MKVKAVRMPAWLGARFEADFSDRRLRPPPAAWALLGAGVLSLALTAVFTWPNLARHQRLLAERAQVEQQLDQQPARRQGSHTASAVDLSEARRVLADLGRPWTALLDRFESVDVPKVYLVQLSVDSGFHAAQMTAEAARLDDVLLYSRKLESDGVLGPIRLTHHEWRAAPGARVIVANLTARLPGGDAEDGATR